MQFDVLLLAVFVYFSINEGSNWVVQRIRAANTSAWLIGGGQSMAVTMALCKREAVIVKKAGYPTKVKM